MPTGATVAALTTSLPETPGGERNWDYRFTWIRDATFMLWGLYTLGFDWEANDFFYFIADVAESEQNTLQIMYGIDGEDQLEERTLDHLSGYEGARPVRIGCKHFTEQIVLGEILAQLLEKEGIQVERRFGLVRDVEPAPVRCDRGAVVHLDAGDFADHLVRDRIDQHHAVAGGVGLDDPDGRGVQREGGERQEEGQDERLGLHSHSL